MKRLFFLTTLLTVCLLVQAQTVMDLQECLRIGLENNYDLRISRNNQKVSDNNVTLGNAGYLPSVSVSSGYTARSNSSDQYPLDGGEVISNRNATTQSLDAAVNLNWTIFEGFRVQTTYAKLQELKTIGELNTQLAVENYIADLTAQYYNYVQHIIRLKNLQKSLELSRERLRVVELRYFTGALSSLDVRQARVDFSSDSSQIIQQNEIINTARIQLNEMMAIDEMSSYPVYPDTMFIFKAIPEKEELYQSALERNTALRLMEKSKTLSELDLKLLQSRNYPYLRFNGSYGFTHYGYNRGTLDRQRTWGPTVGVTLGYTLFDGFNRKREQKNQQIMIENSQLQLEKQQLAMRSDLENMWMAYHSNIELTKLEKEALENAQLHFEAAMDRYQLGDLSGLELREAQNGMINAEQRLIDAQFRTKLYEISLLELSGRVGEYVRF